MSSIVRIRHLFRRRPLLSVGATCITLGTAAAATQEYQANRNQKLALSTQNASSSNQTTIKPSALCLPRKYDAEQIDDYWSQRKISVAVRLWQIMSEISPIAASYWWNTRVHTDAAESKDHLTNLQQEAAIDLREALTNLGPAFVKLGQQISIRPDLVPPHVLKELQQLCDSVRPIPDELAFQLVRSELQIDDLNQIFASTNETTVNTNNVGPLQLVASASLGQVYQTKLKNTDETVAIKVQRPGMRESFSLDLFLLHQYGKFVDRVTSIVTQQRPFHQAFVTAFAQGSYQELDYEAEAQNQIEFQKELHRRTKGRVCVPTVHPNYTTERILTSQWIDGTKLADAPPDQIQALIPLGVELFLIQLLEMGKFHADPHPGNLLVVTQKKNNAKLCLLDFGLIAEVSADERHAMLQAMYHLLQRDFDIMISHDVKELGFLPHDFDTSKLRSVLLPVLESGLLDASVGSDLKRRKATLMDLSNELNQLFFDYPFQVPPFFSLVTRGLGLLEGIALTGDPDFDIFQASAPYVMKRGMAVLGPKLWSSAKASMSGGQTKTDDAADTMKNEMVPSPRRRATSMM